MYPSTATSRSSAFLWLAIAIASLPTAYSFHLPVPQSRVSYISTVRTLQQQALDVTEDVLSDFQTTTPRKKQDLQRKEPVKQPSSSTRQVETVSKRANIEEYFSNPQGGSTPVCRVVTLSDGKLPTLPTVLPPKLFEPPNLLRKLDDIYHAMAHDETRRLKYMATAASNKAGSSDKVLASAYDSGEEEQLVSTLRTSLEDAGFEQLGRRDLELCDALNAGYLLRLSILPDTSKLDPSLARDFYPEHFATEEESATGQLPDQEDLLFDGRVLVYWRGYSKEISQGRLLLPKIDYLQASLVQRSAAWVKGRLDVLERWVSIRSVRGYRLAKSKALSSAEYALERIPNKRIADTLLSTLGERSLNSGVDRDPVTKTPGNIFKLSRYGGSKIRFVGSPNPTDQLTPFVICEESEDCEPCVPGINDGSDAKDLSDRVDKTMYECLNRGEIMCPYDASINAKLNATAEERPAMQLLERVTIGNLIDLFSKAGRGKLLKTLVSQSELVEPTYEEVVVVWRPLPKKKAPQTPRIQPPKFVYDFADMFDIDVGGLPPLAVPEPKLGPAPLEIRSFSSVPMANLLAVLPKTKLIFRPADALVFDLISVFSFLVIFATLKFDNPRLDILALVSGVGWAIRTVLRYSNKLARYDLLVKKFLTSKITHRNGGALKYVATEAGAQRATRAALVYSWLSSLGNQSDETKHKRSEIVAVGQSEVNDMIRQDKDIPIDIEAALNDLEDLDLVTQRDDGNINILQGKSELVAKLQTVWSGIFTGEVALETLVGRRERS